jgi:hypothetical protein
MPPASTPPHTPSPPPPSGFPADRVKGPAIAVIIAMALGILAALAGLVFNMLGVALPQPAEIADEQQTWIAIQGTVGVISSIVGMIVAVVVIIGCVRMMKLQSYGFALTAMILAMIPCISPCCLLGLPFGIWGVVVLSDQHVKTAFDRADLTIPSVLR